MLLPYNLLNKSFLLDNAFLRFEYVPFFRNFSLFLSINLRYWPSYGIFFFKELLILALTFVLKKVKVKYHDGLLKVKQMYTRRDNILNCYLQSYFFFYFLDLQDFKLWSFRKKLNNGLLKFIRIISKKKQIKFRQYFSSFISIFTKKAYLQYLRKHFNLFFKVVLHFNIALCV